MSAAFGVPVFAAAVLARRIFVTIVVTPLRQVRQGLSIPEHLGHVCIPAGRPAPTAGRIASLAMSFGPGDGQYPRTLERSCRHSVIGVRLHRRSPEGTGGGHQ